MSTTSIVPASAALAIPAIARIRTLADELEAMGTTVLMKAVEVGNLLSEAKAALPHGQWIPWLEKNVNFNARTAQRWMKVAEEHAAGRLKYDSVSYLSEAYQLSVAPRPSTAEERTTEPKPGVPAATPAPARRSPAPAIDAEIVNPATIPQDGPEPAPLVIDGIKEAHQPEVVERPTVASGPEMRPDEMERKAMVEAGKTVYANLKRDHNLIAWAESKGLAVRVDRKSIFGNPFVMPGDGNRDDVCDLFGTTYLPNKKSILAALPSLRGKVLLCWCYPERCHAQSLIEALTGGPSK